jgi:hypothetical protein
MAHETTGLMNVQKEILEMFEKLFSLVEIQAVMHIFISTMGFTNNDARSVIYLKIITQFPVQSGGKCS